MCDNQSLRADAMASTFSGNPIFYGPVHFNITLPAEDTRTTHSKELDEMPVKLENSASLEDEIDAQVEECAEEDYERNVNATGVYPIRGHPKGRILIMNNEFKDHRQKRKGSQEDAKKMVVLWQSLGFAVEFVGDLTAQGMKQTVMDFVNSPAMKRADVCAIIVMSHGQKDDFILGDDMNTKTNVSEIVSAVKQSEVLVGKPKMIFFQMCRGKKAQKYTPVKSPGMGAVESDAIGFTEPQSDSEWLRSLLNSIIKPAKKERGAPPRYNTPTGGTIEADCVESDATAIEYTGMEADLMVAFACQPDHVSFRNKEGSWFISAIANQFKKRAKDCDVLEIMEHVSREVGEQLSNMPTKMPKYHECTATVESSDSFNGKKLYLFPGFPKPV